MWAARAAAGTRVRRNARRDSIWCFPYRGVYVRHLGRDQAVAEANQVLFFNATEGYRVSHPVPGGDACLSLVISEPLLRELAPKALLRDGAGLAFRRQRLRIDPRDASAGRAAPA